MDKSIVTSNEGEYLKFIYRRQVEEGKKLRNTDFAGFFDVSLPVVTEVLQKLADKVLVNYVPYYGVELTEKGVEESQKMLRKHRILEVLLVNSLGYDPEKACEEAAKLDYYCSEELINTICRTSEHPKICPCNKVIFRDKECFKNLGDV